MDSQQILVIARRYASIAKETLPITRAWLYGSWAYGTPRSDSDIAFEVRDRPTNIIEAEKQLYRIRRDVDLRIEPIIIEPEYDRSGFSRYVVQHGVPIEV